jgi:hypothetical protein
MAKSDLPILEQRRIEAALVKPIYEEMVLRLGEQQAQQILATAIKKHAVAQGQAYADAARADGGEPSLPGFRALLPQWQAGGALEIDMLEETSERLDFNVTRCHYAEMYREMGLSHIGHVLSCNRDGTFCEGYDPRIRLERSQTIMGGASHCDFGYSTKLDPAGS